MSSVLKGNRIKLKGPNRFLSSANCVPKGTHYSCLKFPFLFLLVCKFKAHKRCAVRATNNCKWTTLASIGNEIIEDEDGVSTFSSPSLPCARKGAALTALHKAGTIACEQESSWLGTVSANSLQN